METQSRLRIAIQKNGRLNNDSMDLLYRCGLKLRVAANALYCRCESLPIDILFVRDNDIPTLVMDGVCDAGIVGENVLFEKSLEFQKNDINKKMSIIKKLGFSFCRLAIPIPNTKLFDSAKTLNGLRSASSYPYLLQQYLDEHII